MTPPLLEMKQVSFRYNENREILHDLNFAVEPGEKVAVIGSNGSGKSTLLNLLLRFYEHQGGEITANGIKIEDIPLEAYREQFSVVSQEPYLFLGNILENVDLGGTAGEQELQAALESSRVSEYLPRMPEGEKTKIGYNGVRLSGGEKQKLAVARALLKNAPVVTLDEATSGFDVEFDAYLHEVLMREMEGKSVVMITHHYHNLEGMDRVYRLQEGRLLEVTSEDLCAVNDFGLTDKLQRGNISQ